MAKPHKGKKSGKQEPMVKAAGVAKVAPPPQPSPARGEGATAPPPQTSPAEGQGVPTMGATLQQRRAHFALTRIRQLADEWQNDAKTQKEFNSYASAMPFMIHANGLGQTAAFYRRKGTDHTYYRLYQLLGDWLGQPDQPFAGQADLLDGVIQADMDAYLAAQVEAMLFLDWVKKLASAFLAREEETPS